MSLAATWREIARTRLMTRCAQELDFEEASAMCVDMYARRFSDATKDEFLSTMDMVWKIYHEKLAS
jgi:hypothetical protein